MAATVVRQASNTMAAMAVLAQVSILAAVVVVEQANMEAAEAVLEPVLKPLEVVVALETILGQSQLLAIIAKASEPAQRPTRVS